MRQVIPLASVAAILAAGPALSACAGSVLGFGPVPVMSVSGATEVRFQSIPDSAEVLVNGVLMGRTPLKLTLSPNQEHTVTYRKEGCKDLVVILATHVGGGWEILNLLDVDGTPMEIEGHEFTDKNPIGRLDCEQQENPT